MRFVLLLLLLPVLTIAQNREARPASSPNIVIVMTDDQGYGDIACHGNPWIKTPTMDVLHASSVRFTNFHSGTTCAPTRASLMTGKNSNKVGVWHTIIGREYLRAGETTMAELFKTAGYSTAIFGKWHLGDNYPFRPQDRGFDEVLIHGGGGVTQTPDYWNNDYFNDTYFHNGKPEKYQGYCTDVWFREATKFVNKNKRQPFLCYIALNAPHGPYHVAPKYSQPYKDNPKIPNPDFYGMITNADEQMGVFIENLKKAGVYENTIFIFMSDNGTAAGVKFDKAGNVDKGYNAGMRATKGSQYEGGHRVPFFLHWPAKKLPARPVDGLAGMVDLLPTLLDLCDIKPKTKTDFDGISLAPSLLQNQPIKPERILITDTQREGYLEEGKMSAVMQGSWRLIDGKELYDLSTDPGQKDNIAQAHPAKVNELQKAYQAWWPDISRHGNAFNRVIVGSEKQPVICLTAHDYFALDNFPAWNQYQIREAKGGNGPWEISVASAGRYRVSLRRYPLESGLAMDAAAPVPTAEPGADPYPAGKPLAIRKAKVKAGTVEKTMAVKPGSKSVDFDMDLPAGDTQLQTWLTDDQGQEYGAFYAYISKLR
ncbi:arylsulfatase [Persicitalea jodogahamensis]|uniref:N-acetylgalactosamine-6-sulfatase n=1 Tax=Persicitalea jodogahamensis TaxID=402147 RepID=A0A8J3GA53_9BACT|nr:arylsulfatase [Persicitalea jodogahamensis]GHB78188.1 N-acetylgalactosamine-6-sulfatase [Persicitalea jodogahamensis]